MKYFLDIEALYFMAMVSLVTQGRKPIIHTLPI